MVAGADWSRATLTPFAGGKQGCLDGKVDSALFDGPSDMVLDVKRRRVVFVENWSRKVRAWYFDENRIATIAGSKDGREDSSKCAYVPLRCRY
jgi:hypothetical protein